MFMVLLLAAIEFGFAFNASLSLGYATRDASLVAAVSGNSPGGDCLVLEKVEEDVSAPADRSRITTVEIYWSDANGALVSGARNVYTRGGSMSCEARDGSTYSLPYRLTTAAYPESDRCMGRSPAAATDMRPSTRSASRSPTSTRGARRSAAS